MCLIINAVHPQLQEKPMNPCELETLLQELTYPDEGNELHAASLRNQLRQLLENSPLTDYQASDSAEPNVELLDKRMISSLARNGLMTSGKRNIGAMARLGMLRSGNNDDSGNKRSIATLAKNGQLPSREPETDNESDNQWVSDKRNIGSLARSGQLGNGKRSIASLARSYELPAYGKRNLASIVRSSVRPVTGGSSYKRNMAALARGNMLPLFGEEYKRNVGALARDWSLPTTKVHSKREASYQEYEKRNIGAMRNSPVHGTKVKRQSSYDDYPSSNAELLEPVFQSSPIDYVELNEVMNQLYPYYENSPPVSDTFHEDKRFLGSLVRDGWSNYRPMSAEKRNIGSLARLGLLRSDLNDYGQQRKYSHQQQDKRHIGALARSGWLPAFRPVRGGRFSRSGRARSQIVGFYPLQERLRQPTAAACERCKTSFFPTSPFSWSTYGGGLHTTAWGQQQQPPRLTALHRRSLRGPFHPSGDYF